MNEEITTFEGLKEEVAKIEGFVEKMIPLHHPEPSLTPTPTERTEPVSPVSATGSATGAGEGTPSASSVAELAPTDESYAIVDPPMQVSSPVHVLETRSFGRQSADHPMVINVTWGLCNG